MDTAIRFLTSNYTLTLFMLGLVASAISLLRKPRPYAAATVAEALFSYFLLFSIAISFFLGFVGHVFFTETVARFIGWESSPFQKELGFACLGFAIVGLLAFRGSFDMRTAAVISPMIFLLGAAGGHIVQILRTQNFAPGNAGVILYTDILLPLFAFILLWLQHRYER